MHRPFRGCVLASFVLLSYCSASAQICGDVNDSGGLTAADALAVLKAAVGQPVSLQCATGECIALEARTKEVERTTLYAYDADGNELGSLAGLQDNTYYVWVRSLGRLARLSEYGEDAGKIGVTGGPGGPSLGDVRYQLLDCQGPIIFVENVSRGLNYVVPTTVLDPLQVTQRFFVFDAADIHTGVVMTASRWINGACENIIQSTDPIARWATPTEVVLPFPVPAKGPLAIAPGAP